MKRERIRKIAIGALGLVFLLSAGNLICHFIDYRQGDEAYGEAETMVELPDFSALPTPAPLPTPTPVPRESGEPVPAESEGPAPTPYIDPYADALSAMDFAALREVNEDVIGWIVIPGTSVSYPLVQGEDNQYYLNHTWKKWRNSVGSIFMECTSDPALTDFHTLIYGHNVRNGTMFGALQSYRKQSFLDAHPSVYLTVDAGTYRYEIFAVYQAEVDSNTYQIGFSGDTSKQTFLNDCLARSVVETGVLPHTYDRILTLSTCTNTFGSKTVRWVVQAVCFGEPPEEAPEPTPEPAGEEIPVTAPPVEPVETTPEPPELPEPTQSSVPAATPQPVQTPPPAPAETPQPVQTPPSAPTPAPEATLLPAEPTIPPEEDVVLPPGI